MKIVVTAEHFGKACFEVSRPEAFGKYGNHCLIAQAAKDAGIEEPYVNTTLIRAKSGKYYVLPAIARRMITEFDQSREDPNYSFNMKLPIEFELDEQYSQD